MRVTVVKSADTMASLAEMGAWMSESTHDSIVYLIDPFQNLINLLEDRIVAAVVHRIDLPDGKHYHSVGVLDIDGITYSVNDQNTTTTESKYMTWLDKLPVAFEESRRYKQILAAAGSHKLRLVNPSTGMMFNIVDELHEFLNDFENRKKE